MFGVLTPSLVGAATCFDNIKLPRLLGSTDDDSYYYSITGFDDVLFLGGTTGATSLFGNGVLTPNPKVAVITRINAATNTVEFSNVYFSSPNLMLITGLGLKYEPTPS